MSRVAEIDIREQVIDAALSQADLAGPDSVSLRQVAADVGRSTMAIYSRFKDRDDLMQAVRVRVTVDMATITRARVEALEDASLEEQLLMAGYAMIDYALEHPHLFNLTSAGVALTRLDEGPQQPDAAAAWAFLLEPLRNARTTLTPRALQTELDLRLAITHGVATMAINGQYGPDPRSKAYELLAAATVAFSWNREDD